MLLNYKDILLEHGKCQLPSRSQADISVKFGKYTFANPLIMANMPSICHYEECRFLDSENMLYVYPRVGANTVDVLAFVRKSQSHFRCVSVSVGVCEKWVDFVKQCHSENLQIDYFTVDIAFSYSDYIIPVVDAIKTYFPESFIIVGNGHTVEWLEWLGSLGVHAAKVGVGVSPACRTRQYTGFGSSTVTDLWLLSERVAGRCYNQDFEMLNGYAGYQVYFSEPLSIKVIADGGLTEIGDIAKAVHFGADMVMSGTLFADCVDVCSYKGYAGNSSSYIKGHNNHIEGARVEPVRITASSQTLEDRLKLINDSLKSSVSYSGGVKLEDIRNCKFRVV